MRVGVPKEVKAHEYRVGLAPAAVREYVAVGHRVVLETVDVVEDLRAGLKVSRGRPTFEAVAVSLGLSFSPIEHLAA